MAETRAAAGLTPQLWDDEFFMEYVRGNPYRRYMGTGENAMIQLKDDLGRKKGDKVTFAAVRKLDGAGVTGNQVLEGNEEELDSRSMTVTVNPLRHAVVVTDWEEQKSAIELRNTARSALRTWAVRRLRDDISQALLSINGVPYASATENQKDAWLADNADRVLFGAALGNNSSNDHSASLANIDNTADKLTPAVGRLARELATMADPGIRPMMLENGEEWWVMFCHPRSFRDLSGSTEMQQANREAWTRGADNPLFRRGDLIMDAIIYREMKESFPVLTGVGNGGIDVVPNFLCGAQAVGVAWAQRTRSTTDTRDYGFRHGVGIQEIRGIEKLRFGTGAADTDDLVQNGVVTVYTAGVASA